MDSRRDFLKKAALLSGAAMLGTVPESIQKALAIEPDSQSTFLDAEHIVILMQENRSFDHTFGSLQGVRGYRDPRVHLQPDLKPVWFQTNSDGETYAPFRLDIKATNATWMGSLPHSWDNQTDARNGGRYDKWLIAKPLDYKGYEKKPMTLGHYTREDIPFYYAFADAFTVCDQHFCSSLTGTTPNRLYLWTGTIRPDASSEAKACVYNEDADHETEVSWSTFPERLEDAGISWKIYQNELDIPSGLKGEQESWLSNFSDNPIEFFKQYNVRFSAGHRAYLKDRLAALPQEIADLKRAMSLQDGTEQLGRERAKQLDRLNAELKRVQEAAPRWTEANFAKLSEREKSIHAKAFCVNGADPQFRAMDQVELEQDGKSHKIDVPKGDVFYQFRQDVDNGKLPTVSWLVGPERFSDHPSSAWYGAWYVSEALDILTKNPEVWKKTIFILTYDENDGYFDHVPPFVGPNPYAPNGGKVSEDIDPRLEFVTHAQDAKFHPGYSTRESSIGLGYRVPFVVASPWSRGGCVCSQVFDHTSVLQLLETILSHRSGKKVEEPQISKWRRAVCGDLSSVFRPYDGGRTITPQFPERDKFIEEIYRAQFKSPPTDFKALSEDDIEEAKRNPHSLTLLPPQERGLRQSCPLPYELYADGAMSHDKSALEVTFRAGSEAFGKQSAGSPFNVYAYQGEGKMQVRAYAVSAGHAVSDHWRLSDFEGGRYWVRADGPNGFMREFRGGSAEPNLAVSIAYPMDAKMRPSGNVEVVVENRDATAHKVEIVDLTYGGPSIQKAIEGGSKARFLVESTQAHGWYDVGIHVIGNDSFLRRCAGRVETGRWSITDPAMA